jgi:hypothetical protein
MRMIEQGARMKTMQVINWYDCGKKGDAAGSQCHSAEPARL